MKKTISIGIVLLIFSFSESSCGQIEEFDNSIINNPNDTDVINDSIFTCSFEKYMSLTPVGDKSAQASACYGDYFIQGYNYNGYITIYDLNKKTCIGTLRITNPVPNSRIHVNTMNFGVQRFSPEDFFPLLYISSGYPTDGVFFVYVYRLVKNNVDGKDVFSISLVQTISLHGFDNWTEGVIDCDGNRLFVIHYPTGFYCYAQYDLPRLEDGDVSLNKKDCIKDVWLERLPKNSRNQGQIYVGGKIILVTGVPSANESIALISVDVAEGKRDYIIDLAEVGLVNPNNPRDNTFEPEGVIVYNGQLMICYRTAIYTFTIEKCRRNKYLGICSEC